MHNLRSIVQTYTLELILFAVTLFVPTWMLFVIPELNEIPPGFSYSADLNSYDNLYDPEHDQFKGEQRSMSTFAYKTVSGDSSALTIRNTFDVRAQDGTPIFSVAREYGIGAHTGKHMSGHGDKDRIGYLFAPRMGGLFFEAPDKSSFTYWHVNYDVPVFMEFRDEDTLYGLKTYRYESDFIADQTKELTGKLPDVGIKYGITLDVHLQTWIEPVTGDLVSYEDAATAYYYDLETGARLYPWNKFRNAYTIDSTIRHAALAARHKETLLLLEIVFPIALLLVSLAALVVRNALRAWRNPELSSNRSVLFVPVLVFMFMASLAIVAWRVAATSIALQTEAKFETDVDQINTAISDRLAVYMSVLRGARGLFEASDFVSRSEWQTYVHSLDVNQNFPGIQGIGFSKVVPTNKLSAHVASVRAEGFPDFAVRPAGERDPYTSIVYIEPFDARNRQAFGFDMFQEPVRHKAMAYARDTGEPALSGKVTLVQEIDKDVQSGFLIYLPLYRKGDAHASIEDRRNAIDGYIYAPFRMSNFMHGTFAPEQFQIDVEVFDSARSDFLPEDLMYNEHQTGSPATTGLISTSRKVSFGGHVWTVRYTAFAQYQNDLSARAVPLAILGGGLSIAALLFVITYVLNTRRNQALALARSMTDGLRKRTEENEKIRGDLEVVNKELASRAKDLSDKVREIEMVNKHMVDREERMIELKKEVERLKGGNAS